MELFKMRIGVFLVLVTLGILQTDCQVLKFEQKPQAANSEPLTLLWGIADTTAYVGKLFTYTLPSDAFQGNIVTYTVSSPTNI